MSYFSTLSAFLLFSFIFAALSQKLSEKASESAFQILKSKDIEPCDIFGQSNCTLFTSTYARGLSYILSGDISNKELSFGVVSHELESAQSFDWSSMIEDDDEGYLPVSIQVRDKHAFVLLQNCLLYRNPLGSLTHDVNKKSLPISKCSDMIIMHDFIYVLGHDNTTQSIVRIHISQFDIDEKVVYTFSTESDTRKFIREANGLLVATGLTEGASKLIDISVPLFNIKKTFTLPPNQIVETMTNDDLNNEVSYFVLRNSKSNAVFIASLNTTDEKIVQTSIQNTPTEGAVSHILLFHDHESNKKLVTAAGADLYIHDVSVSNGNMQMKESKHEMPTNGTIVHIARDDDKLFVISKFAPNGYQTVSIRILQEDPGSKKISLPSWVILIVIGAILAVEYFVLIAYCGFTEFKGRLPLFRKDAESE